MTNQTPVTGAVLRLPRVKQESGLGRSSIYSGVKAGTFPAPIKLGTRAVGWLASEIDAWVKLRAAGRTTVKGVAA